MDFNLDPNIEENYNLKTGVTEEFSNLNIDEYNEACDLSKNQDLQEIACFTKKLHVNQIIYTALPIEYSAISEDEIATIYNINKNIIEKLCSLHFIKIILPDISSCSYVALICIGTHEHLLPLPEKISANIKTSLQNLIKQAINNNETLTSCSFTAGNN
ncbi:27286_t:CDS:2 [Gigaspora margarita]|uniref:27286_t:CDS:1 n=1 Tax=Gigaspora margarita TaxID=4874 RepID=A0ABN7V4J8_GIGMA|nr:27286_t:CDS:2 [Gigaspora margarita]